MCLWVVCVGGFVGCMWVCVGVVVFGVCLRVCVAGGFVFGGGGVGVCEACVFGCVFVGVGFVWVCVGVDCVCTVWGFVCFWCVLGCVGVVFCVCGVCGLCVWLRCVFYVCVCGSVWLGVCVFVGVCVGVGVLVPVGGSGACVCRGVW